MTKRVRRGDPQRRRYWEELVRRWREGGEAVRAFCRAEGVRESAFYFWRRELARRNGRAASNGTPTQPHSTAPHQSAPHQSAPHQSAPHQSAPHPITPHLITSRRATPTARSSRRAFRQTPRSTSRQAAPSTPRWSNAKPSFLPVRVVESRVAETPGGVEIVLERGRAVRVAPGFDRQTLADVLAVLEASPC